MFITRTINKTCRWFCIGHGCVSLVSHCFMHECMYTPWISPWFVRCEQSLANCTGQYTCYTVMVVTSALHLPKFIFEISLVDICQEQCSTSHQLRSWVTYGSHTASTKPVLGHWAAALFAQFVRSYIWSFYTWSAFTFISGLNANVKATQ